MIFKWTSALAQVPRRTLLVGLLLLAATLTACDAAIVTPIAELPAPVVLMSTVTPQPTIAVTSTPLPTATEAPTATPEPEEEVIETTPTAVVVSGSGSSGTGSNPAPTASGEVQVAPTTAGNPTSAPPVAPTAAPASGVSFHTYSAPVIIANYMPWYNPESWSLGCTADSPAGGPYQSSDPATISRHIAEARSAGLDGFAVHWGGPGDITDANLKQVLGQGYGATVTYLHHFFYGTASRAQVISSLQTIMGYTSTYGSWVRYGGKPVIMFADMGRIDRSGGLTAIQAWAEVRNAVDPNRTAIWVAEGLDPAYMQVFDGLYIYRIDHDCCPGAYQSAGRWSGWVRDYEKQYGPRYFVATIQPGWDDSRTIDPACNGVRLSAQPFARDRENGAYYDRTFAAAMSTNPDMMIVHSFNEWVEGSQIEPSAAFGSYYLEKTAQFAAQFKSSR